jgi:hypothetical protein
VPVAGLPIPFSVAGLRVSTSEEACFRYSCVCFPLSYSFAVFLLPLLAGLDNALKRYVSIVSTICRYVNEGYRQIVDFLEDSFEKFIWL